MMNQKTKRRPYILGSDSKMVAMRLPAITREQISKIAKDTGKSKTLVVVDAVSTVSGDPNLTK